MDTEAVVDTTTDLVEAVADNVEAISIVVKNNPVAIAGAVVGGAIVGAVVSHFVTKLHLSLKYEAILNEELEKTAAHYATRVANLKKQDGKVENDVDKTTIINVKKAEDISVKSGYTPYHKVAEVTKPDGPSSTIEHGYLDYDAEEKKKLKHQPYILDGYTFELNEEEHDQVVLTYYKEDEVLTSEDDQPISNWREIIGHDNLKFGHGSDDPDVVHIRNDRLNTDYQVFLNIGSYVKEILGLEEE